MLTPGTGHHAVENREWIDFAKGVAIILVVLYHCALFLSELDLAEGTGRLRSLLNFYPMPMFFFVAGLTSRRMLTWSFPDLWRRRLLTLVYLYFLWSLIRVLFYLVVPPLRASSESAPTDLFNIAVLPVLPTSSYWFVWALAIFTLVAWALRTIPPVVQIVAAGALAVAATTPWLLDTDNVGWDRVAQNLVFFLVAMFFPHQAYRFAGRVRVWHALALAVVYAALAMVIVVFHASRIPGVFLLECVVAVSLGIAASTVLVRLRWLSFVSAVGQRSFQIYLVHLFVVALAVWAMQPLASVETYWFARFAPYLLAIVVLFLSVYLATVLRPVSWLWVSPFRTRPKKNVASQI